MKGRFKGGISFFLVLCGHLPPDTYPHKQERVRNQERVYSRARRGGRWSGAKIPEFNPFLSKAPPDHLPH